MQQFVPHRLHRLHPTCMPKSGKNPKWLWDAATAADKSTNISKTALLWDLCATKQRRITHPPPPRFPTVTTPGGQQSTGLPMGTSPPRPAPRPGTHPAVLQQRHHPAGLCGRGKRRAIRSRAPTNGRSTAPPRRRLRPYHPLAAAVEGVPLPEAAAVAADEAHLARREFEARPPHQRAVPEDPHRRRQLRLRARRLAEGGGGEERGRGRLLGALRVADHGGAGGGARCSSGGTRRRGPLTAGRAARPAPSPARLAAGDATRAGCFAAPRAGQTGARVASGGAGGGRYLSPRVGAGAGRRCPARGDPAPRPAGAERSGARGARGGSRSLVAVEGSACAVSAWWQLPGDAASPVRFLLGGPRGSPPSEP